MSLSSSAIATAFPKPLVSAHIRIPSIGSTNPIDDFFGSKPTSARTYDGHHLDAPPPYIDAPEHVMRTAEPVTLAMYLFKFGFLFPPFWIMGVIILRSPLRAPNNPVAWLPEKTDAERQLIIKRIRTIELKWARRCLYALLVHLLIIITIFTSATAWHASKKTDSAAKQ